MWLMILLACGGGGDQTGTDSQPVVEPSKTVPFTPEGASDYCEATVDIFCPYYQRCNRIVGTEDTCRETFLEACNAVYEPFYASFEEEGLLALSLEGVETCRAHLETVACDQQISDLDLGCADIWQGLAPEGGSCGPGIGSFVCEAGTTCVLDLATFCGTCEAFVPDGSSCATGERCSAASVCDAGVCKPRPQVGETCADDGPSCVVGSWCEGGVCRSDEWVDVGQACDFSHTCQYGAACVDGICQAEGAMDAPCDPTVGCRSGFCGNNGVCKPLKSGGQNCASSNQCVSGLCDGTGKCLDLPGYCFVELPTQ